MQRPLSAYLESCFLAAINSTRADNNFAGVQLGNSTAETTIDDCLIVGNTIGRAGGSTQVYAVGFGKFLTLTDSRLHDNNLNLGNTLMFYDSVATLATPPASLHLRDNIGWPNRRAGAEGITDGGVIAHGLAATPTKYGAISSVAGEIVSVTSVNGSSRAIAIKKPNGTAGTAQLISWWAEL